MAVLQFRKPSTLFPSLIAERAAAEKALAEAKEMLKYVNDEIEVYLDGALKTARKDKMFGTVNLEVEGFEIKHTVNKKVTWEQDKLADVFCKIQESGDDPYELIDVKYDVSERKFTAWPQSIQKVFEPARTIQPGTVKMEIKPCE